MDRLDPAQDLGEVPAGVAGHPAFELAQQAIRVGVSPREALRPGDLFERALTAATLERADHDRVEELIALVKGAGVMAGKTTALCLGAPPEWVDKVVEAMLGGDEHA